jgi:hypothetical protein
MPLAQLHARPGPGGEVLVAYIPIRDVVHTTADGLEFQVPADAFVHSNPRALVRLHAVLADGRPLPSWLHLDGVTGRLAGTPPRDFAGTLEIRVIARDDHGLQAETRLRVTFAAAPMRAGSGQEHAMPGKRGAPSFAEQLRQVRQQPASAPSLVDQALSGGAVLGKADVLHSANPSFGV